MNSLRGKTALVTGGARRLGAAIVRELAMRGATVLIHYHHSEAEAVTLNRELANGGCFLRGDLATDEGREFIFREALGWGGGRIDLWVNNAARFCPDDASAAELAVMHAVNVEAPLDFTRWLADAECRGACVIQVLDARIARPIGCDPPFAAYTAGKRELAASVPRMAAALAFAGVRVNAVAPGDVLPPEALHEKARPMPLAVRPSPADVAHAIAFLAEADPMTGQTLYLDSGFHLLCR